MCEEHKIKPDKLLTALADIGQEGTTGSNYNHWSLDSLVDYIVNNHHQYLRDNLPEIKFYARTVEKIHGDAHSELLRIYVALLKLSDEIMTHMDQEEDQLFPLIKRLESIKGNPDGAEPRICMTYQSRSCLLSFVWFFHYFNGKSSSTCE